MKPSNIPLTREQLVHKFDYNPETGLFKHRHGKCKGRQAGFYDVHGYIRLQIGEKHYPAHRIALLISGVELIEGLVVDHKNRIKDDNRLTNLRQVTMKENATNSDRMEKPDEEYLYTVSKTPKDGTYSLRIVRRVDKKSIIAIRIPSKELGVQGWRVFKEYGIDQLREWSLMNNIYSYKTGIARNVFYKPKRKQYTVRVKGQPERSFKDLQEANKHRIYIFRTYNI